MNRQKWILLGSTLVLIALSGWFLGGLRTNQRLGAPGVRTSPIPDSVRLQVELPAEVLDYKSEPMDVGDMVRKALPQDTSFGQRKYTASDGFSFIENVVLMGGDRTSLHKPQICLRGSGYVIVKTEPEIVKVSRPYPYDLPVMKLTLNKEKADQPGPERALYVYWFAADGAYTRSHGQRMWWMFTHLVSTGVLQRWAYLNCFAPCEPGQEAPTFERMKQFIAASVPKYQLVPAAEAKMSSSR
jgi:hypothetical protein